MTVSPIRFFSTTADIAAIGGGLLAATLPPAAWTHAAHLAATAWLIRMRGRFCQGGRRTSRWSIW